MKGKTVNYFIKCKTLLQAGLILKSKDLWGKYHIAGGERILDAG